MRYTIINMDSPWAHKLLILSYSAFLLLVTFMFTNHILFYFIWFFFQNFIWLPNFECIQAPESKLMIVTPGLLSNNILTFMQKIVPSGLSFWSSVRELSIQLELGIICNLKILWWVTACVLYYHARVMFTINLGLLLRQFFSLILTEFKRSFLFGSNCTPSSIPCWLIRKGSILQMRWKGSSRYLLMRSNI